MTDLRTVAIDYETIQTIESVGEDLLRQDDPDRGLRLLTLVLTWRTLGKREFHCNVDESAGMAEAFERGRQAREAYDEAERLSNVIELHSYGKCVK